MPHQRGESAIAHLGIIEGHLYAALRLSRRIPLRESLNGFGQISTPWSPAVALRGSSGMPRFKSTFPYGLCTESDLA